MISTFRISLFQCFLQETLNENENIFLLEEKTAMAMNAISETYICGHNVLELFDVLPIFSFTTRETQYGCCRSKGVM